MYDRDTLNSEKYKQELEKAKKIKDKCNMIGVEIPGYYRMILWIDSLKDTHICINKDSLMYKEYTDYQY